MNNTSFDMLWLHLHECFKETIILAPGADSYAHTVRERTTEISQQDLVGAALSQQFIHGIDLDQEKIRGTGPHTTDKGNTA
jgi:hypothetical protein